MKRKKKKKTVPIEIGVGLMKLFGQTEGLKMYEELKKVKLQEKKEK